MRKKNAIESAECRQKRLQAHQEAAVCRGALYILFLCVTNCGINIVFLMLKG